MRSRFRSEADFNSGGWGGSRDWALASSFSFPLPFSLPVSSPSPCARLVARRSPLVLRMVRRNDRVLLLGRRIGVSCSSGVLVPTRQGLGLPTREDGRVSLFRDKGDCRSLSGVGHCCRAIALSVNFLTGVSGRGSTCSDRISRRGAPPS